MKRRTMLALPIAVLALSGPFGTVLAAQPPEISVYLEPT